jgi:CheY-like chemotaxis protein
LRLFGRRVGGFWSIAHVALSLLVRERSRHQKVELGSEQEMSAVSNARGFVQNCGGDEAGPNVVTRVLTQAGCRVREATNRREALALAAQGPALLVLDVNMRGMNGLDGFNLHLVKRLQPENLYRILPDPSVGARRQQA